MKEEQKPKIVSHLDHSKADRYRVLILSQITKVIIAHPKCAESAAGALSACITAAFHMAKSMWGVSEAVRALKAAVDIEAGRDKAKEN
jgi:hypothetical protein